MVIIVVGACMISIVLSIIIINISKTLLNMSKPEDEPVNPDPGGTGGEGNPKNPDPGD